MTKKEAEHKEGNHSMTRVRSLSKILILDELISAPICLIACVACLRVKCASKEASSKYLVCSQKYRVSIKL